MPEIFFVMTNAMVTIDHGQRGHFPEKTKMM